MVQNQFKLKIMHPV